MDDNTQLQKTAKWTRPAPCWTFRPTALQQYTPTISRSALFDCYYKDSRRAQQEGDHPCIPRRVISSANSLRTCQWNVHYFDGGGSAEQKAIAIVQALLETDADLMVLNEFGAGRQDRFEPARQCALELLGEHGYHVQVAKGRCPTVICTKLPVVESTTFALDRKRHAVGVQVCIDASGGSSLVEGDGIGTVRAEGSMNGCHSAGARDNRDASTAQGSHTMWFYGTHLEDCDHHGGRYRRDEMTVLLETVNDKQNAMIVGDFNQQRQQDYTKQEWKVIAENKQGRNSPLDDGVSTLLHNAGYSCIWDPQLLQKQPYGRSARCTTNWNHHASPPPSTHWTGTIVDYCYIKDDRLELAGVYVSPNDMSDHRLIVCDWNLKAA